MRTAELGDVTFEYSTWNGELLEGTDYIGFRVCLDEPNSNQHIPNLKIHPQTPDDIRYVYSDHELDIHVSRIVYMVVSNGMCNSCETSQDSFLNQGNSHMSFVQRILECLYRRTMGTIL